MTLTKLTVILLSDHKFSITLQNHILKIHKCYVLKILNVDIS